MTDLKRFFAAPIFDDEIKTQQAYLLNAILLTLICAPIPFVIYTFFHTPEYLQRTLIQAGFGEVVNLSLLLVLRRGFVTTAAVIQVSAFWLFFTVTAITGTGIHGEAYLLGYVLVISIAGMLLGKIGAFIFTGLSLAAGGLMVFLEMRGLLNLPHDNSALTTWMVSLVLFPVGAILQNLASRTTQNALARARASEERYRLISKVTSDYTFSTDRDETGNLRLSWVAGAFEEITGYTYDEYIASGGWLAHLHPDDIEKDAQDMSALRTGQSIISEIRTYRKDGDLRSVQVSAHPVWDARQNQMSGIVGAVKDITERNQAESALRKSEEIYRQAIEVAGAVPYRQKFDEEGRITYDFMGEGIKQITGYGPDEFNDDLWGTLTQERHLLDDLAPYSLDEAIERVRSGDKPIWKCEHLIKARDGKTHWVFEAAVDLRDENGIAHGSIGLYQDITDRKQAEASLRYERDLLQIFMDNIPDTIYFKDTSSQFVRVNKAQAQFFNISDPQVAIGKTDLDFQPYEIAHQFMEEEQELLKTGQSIINRIEFNPTRVGKPRWISSTKVPVKDSDGNIVGLIGISRDITEQIETHDNLQKISLQQAAILNNIPDIAWLKDKNSRYIAVNDQFAKRVEMKMEDILGKTDPEVWKNPYAEMYRNTDIEIMQTRQPRNTEELELDNQGNEHWVETSKTPVLNIDGAVIGIAGIARNITERKKTERAEQSRREMLEKVIELGKLVAEVQDLRTTLQRIWHSIHDELNFDRLGIFLFDAEKNSMNGTYGTNHQGEMVDESNLHISLNIENIETVSFRKVLHQATGLYTTQNYSLEHGIPRGHIMYGVKDYAAVSARAGDKPVAVITVDNLLSQRTISKEQLEALRLFAGYAGLAIENARLNSAIQTELTQRQLLIEELETKNAELERFTYTVSHDLKSPLVTITGFLGYLEKDALAGNTDQLRGNINRISNAARKMQALLNDLLELSRVGRLMNPPEEVSFAEIVHEAVDRVRGKLDEVKALIEIQQDLPVVKGDRTRLVEVMQNLIENAAKYTIPNVQPRIEIGYKSLERDRSAFYVRDNGIGIAPPYHENIFGLFNKLNATSEGTGIGLTLVRRIIEVHGGQIWVESDTGQGATFYFTLPTKHKE